jgi:hypothetical protein
LLYVLGGSRYTANAALHVQVGVDPSVQDMLYLSLMEAASLNVRLTGLFHGPTAARVALQRLHLDCACASADYVGVSSAGLHRPKDPGKACVSRAPWLGYGAKQPPPPPPPPLSFSLSLGVLLHACCSASRSFFASGFPLACLLACLLVRRFYVTR